MNPLLVVSLYYLALLFMLEVSLRKLYQLAYEIVPEDQRQDCEEEINLRWPWTNRCCQNDKLKRISGMCIRIFQAAAFLGLIFPAFAIFVFALSNR